MATDGHSAPSMNSGSADIVLLQALLATPRKERKKINSHVFPSSYHSSVGRRMGGRELCASCLLLVLCCPVLAALSAQHHHRLSAAANGAGAGGSARGASQKAGSVESARGASRQCQGGLLTLRAENVSVSAALFMHRLSVYRVMYACAQCPPRRNTYTLP